MGIYQAHSQTDMLQLSRPFKCTCWCLFRYVIDMALPGSPAHTYSLLGYPLPQIRHPASARPARRPGRGVQSVVTVQHEADGAGTSGNGAHMQDALYMSVSECCVGNGLYTAVDTSVWGRRVQLVPRGLRFLRLWRDQESRLSPSQSIHCLAETVDCLCVCAVGPTSTAG